MLHKVNIGGMAIDPGTNTPIIILKLEEDDRAVPIWIGLLEAISIVSALQNISFDRPMTHDLCKNFMDVLNVIVTKVEVCDLKDNTYYAKIYCTSEDNKFTLDARPSDAIAMALRFNASIYVDDIIIEKAHAIGKDVEVMDKSEEGKKWADYLNKLSPDDFGKYKV